MEASVAPLAAIAAGGYGRRELAPGLRPRLALSPSRKQLIRRRSCRASNAGVHRRRGYLLLGFWLRAGSRGAVGPGMLAKNNPSRTCRPWLTGGTCGAVRAYLLTLECRLAARFAGPDAGCWRDAVGSALSPTRRYAPRDAHAFGADKPDVKRGPTVTSGTCSARSGPTPAPRMTLKHPGLSSAPLPVAGAVSFALARRSGRGPSQQVAATRHRTSARPRGDSRGPAARALFDLFRYHARNIVAAMKSAPRSPLVAPSMT